MTKTESIEHVRLAADKWIAASQRHDAMLRDYAAASEEDTIAITSEILAHVGLLDGNLPTAEQDRANAVLRARALVRVVDARAAAVASSEAVESARRAYYRAVAALHVWRS